MLPHSTTMSRAVGPQPLDRLLRLGVRLRTGGEHDPTAAARRHHRGQEEAEATDTAGDDVGESLRKTGALLGGTTTGISPLRHAQHQLSGVFGGADGPDRGRGLRERVGGVLGHRQHPSPTNW